MSNISISADQAKNQEEIYASAHAHPSSENESSQLDTATGSKQRRRRTSPRDHAILESAYQKNSKPDKEERLNLVKQVDLGEKEVQVGSPGEALASKFELNGLQIWFQNRRQNDRRKSKPLLPHELIPHFRNGIPTEATSQLPSPENSQEVQEEQAPATTDEQAQKRHDHSSPRTADLRSILNNSDATAASAAPALDGVTSKASPSLSTPPPSFESPAQRSQAAQTDTSPLSTRTPSVTQVTKKRSHEQMRGRDATERDAEGSPKDAKALRRTSSFVRLAVNADGSVKVRVNNETTPSPPKQRAPPPSVSSRRSSGLMRAQSDVASTFQFKDASPAVKGAPGRSRDARTWEFYCDRSSRSSLAARAEEAATGSAVGALGLMRSASQRRSQALSPNPSKHNLRRRYSGLKNKPSFARAQSSMARLQGSDGAYDEPTTKPKKNGHQRQHSGSDSEKENWLPGTRDAVHDLRRTRPSAPRSTALHELDTPTTESTRSASTSQKATGQENRSIPGSGAGKGADMDCVQGLLSLSQGAWR
ncbi:Homeobox protein yox1 [Neophaeococcomyces mojaviensis]|uniref:Homeobox protein yox1 n=1 Tax=Neophaeococcomyces mojaviensis TaxID=3383035 RepID=A0ACC3AE12_9EURO|nr:Homeobox protein yox1 [Knufia sp. JES_112]